MLAADEILETLTEFTKHFYHGIPYQSPGKQCSVTVCVVADFTTEPSPTYRYNKSVKRDLRIWKKIYIREKRPIYVKGKLWKKADFTTEPSPTYRYRKSVKRDLYTWEKNHTWELIFTTEPSTTYQHGVATTCRLLKIIGLFCRI